MLRVIQDSDDELDNNVEVDVQQAEAKVASPKQSASDASSTEALRRQIEAAHRAHLQSQFPMTDNQLSAAAEDNHQKRKAPPEFELYGKANGNSVSRLLPVTCAKRMKGVLDTPSGNLQQDQSLIDQTSQPAYQHIETIWILDGTMREAYAQHNPNAMFPEPSSTVPNATLTQQRVLEGILAPTLLGSELDAGRTSFRPDASIPWSEYLKSPTNTGEQLRSSAQHSHASQHAELLALGPALDVDSGFSVSQSNRRESLTLVGCPLTLDKSPLIVDDQQELTVSSIDEVAFQATLPQATPSSTANESLPFKIPRSSRNSRKSKRIPSLGSTSDDDLADLGLPKEQYTSRPSRSQSLKTSTLEPIDYSVRPLTATRVNSRRKSTPAKTSVAKLLSTPDRIQQICDMGFTPSTSAKALKENNGDVTQSVGWLITNRVADDELVSHTSQMSRDDNKQRVLDTGTNGYDSDVTAEKSLDSLALPVDPGTESVTISTNVATAATYHASSFVQLKSPAKVQIMIPAKPPKIAPETAAAPEVPHKKAKRTNTISDQSEATTTNDAEPKTKVEQKRGRGRPKKSAKIVSKTEPVHEEEAERARAQMCDTPLGSVNGNDRPIPVQQAVEEVGITNTTMAVQPSSSGIETTKHRDATSRSTPEPQELPDRPEVEPITPERIKKCTPRKQPSTDKPKVPYRVGLSRRTRIAPLLRVIKK